MIPRKRTPLSTPILAGLVAICFSLDSMQGQTGEKPSPTPQLSPSPSLPLIPGVKESDPLTGPAVPWVSPLPVPTKRDLQIIRETFEKKTYDPFSRVDLGFEIPRISALKAVRVTLDLSPQILFQKAAVRGSAGTVQVTQGAFDTTITGSIASNASRNERYIQSKPANPVAFPNPLVARTGVINYELGLQKTLENGIVINPNVTFSQSANTDFDHQYNDTNQGTVNFTVTIPLAKGGGTLTNKAPEIAARYDLLASVLQLRFISAQSLLTTIQDYWACKAAEETYQLQAEAVESADRLVTISAALIQADERAPDQLPQILAERANSVASRTQAESSLIVARQNLAVAMGFGAASLPLAPLVADDFPQPEETEHYPPANKLIASALLLRDDLRGVRETVKSQKVLMDAAYLNLRPTVNLQFAASYVPLQSRTNLTNTHGNTWEVGALLSLNWPVENNTAIGLYIQSQSSFQNSQITVESIEMAVESSVITALAQLKAAAANVKVYRDAVRWYQQTLAAQEKLFQLGQATLVDTITIRQNLINAELSYITAQQSYAVSLAQLRFATGTLIFSDEKGSWIDSEVWKTVPFAFLKKP